nr:relaxase/mobilization nuclease domain-containing protein [Sneathiella aquimaris]
MQTRNLHTTDPRAASAIMEATSRAKPNRCKKPAYHFILAFDPEDDKVGKINPDMMKEIADKALTRLELQEHQALIYAHQDKEHPHIHFLVNRIHPDTGKAWNRHNEGRRLLEFCGDIAREYDLNIPHDRNRKQEKDKDKELDLDFAEEQLPEYGFDIEQVIDRLEADGKLPDWLAVANDPYKLPTRRFSKDQVLALREKASDGLLRAAGWDDVSRVMRNTGLKVQKHGQGLVVTDGKAYIGISAINRKCSLKGLEKRFGQDFDTWRRAKAVGAVTGIETERVKSNRVLAADVADMELRGVQMVFEEVHSAEWHVDMREGHLARHEQRHKRQQEHEKRHELHFLDGLSKTYRDPAKARRDWIKLDAELGWERAALRIQENPQIIGPMRGVELVGGKTPDRRAAERSFRYLQSRRMKWLKARDRTQLIAQDLEKHHSLLAQAKRDYRRLIDSLGQNHDMMELLREKIRRRYAALDRLTPKMIREADMSEDRRTELDKALRKHNERKRARSRQRQLDREMGIDPFV